MRAKRSRLLKKFVDQRGFSMVDVGNDGDIAKFGYHSELAVSTQRPRIIQVDDLNCAPIICASVGSRKMAGAGIIAV
jgi:hypothetical protein